MEADALALGIPARERAEPGERSGGRCLVETRDGDGDLRLGVVRGERGSALELAQGRDLSAQALQGDTVEQLVAGVATLGPALELRELARRRQADQPRGWREARNELGQAARKVRVQQILGADGVRRVGLRRPGDAPGRLRGRSAPRQ